MSDLSSLLTGTVLGSPEQQQQAKDAADQGGVLGSLGSTLQDLPGQIGGAIGQSGFAGALGEGVQNVSNVLGKDVLSGRSLSGFERALPIAGLAGLALGGAMWLGRDASGPSLWHTVRAAEGDRGSIGFSSPNVVGRTGVLPTPEPGPLSSLNTPRLDPDVVWGLVNHTTNRLLGVSSVPDQGFPQLGSALYRGTDPNGLVRMTSYQEAIGQRLVDEVQVHTDGAQLHQLPQQGPLAAAAYEMARWQFALDRRIGNSRLLQGAGFKEVLPLWERLRDGEELSVDDTTKLMNAQVRFADAVQWIQHPELALHPLVGVNAISMDKAGNVDVGLKVLDFDAKGFDRITPKQLNDRFSAMFALHPSALVDHMRANVSDFFRDYVQPDAVAKYRDWYPAAKADIQSVAQKMGVSPNHLTAMASILSAGESWETNIQKAADVMQRLEPIAALGAGERAGAITRLVKDLKGIGVKASADDVTRSLLTYGVEDPGDFFFTGKRTDGMSLQQIRKEWEKGGDLSQLVQERTRGQDYQALKQPSFWFGIWQSDPADLEDQSRALYQMLHGDLWAPGEQPLNGRADFTADARGRLPVVTDRQAFKVAMGVAANPETWLSGQKGPYDQISQAYRLAAAEIGDVDGRPLLPGELQAITWMELRRQTGVVNDQLEPYARGDRAASRAAGVDVAPQATWPKAGGSRPLVFNDRVLNLALNGPPEQVRWGDVAGDLSKQVDPAELNGGRADLKAARDVVVRSNADGTTQVLGGPDAPPETFRGLVPSRLFDDQGRQTWTPATPYQVDDVRAEYERLNASTKRVADENGRRLPKAEQGGTGATLMRTDQDPNLPWRRPGYWMVLAPLQQAIDDGSGRVVKTADQVHREFLARLNQRGISPVSVESTRPVTGVTPEWGEEQRVPLMVQFASADDAAKAHGLLYEPVDPKAPKPYQSGWAPTPETGAAGYIRQHGRDLGLENRRVSLDTQADPKVGRELAAVYAKAPVFEDTPQVRRSWGALARETASQFEYLTNTLGVRVEFVDEDPYASAAAMRRDVLENRRLKVYKTADDQAHPLLTNEQNDQFRAVHDFFGHAAMGNDFSRNGEEIAWAKHSLMYSKEALPALTAETRAQNSYLNFSRRNVARRARGLDAEFGEQKVFMVPDKFTTRPGVYEPGKNRTWADELMPEEKGASGTLDHVDVPSAFVYVNGPDEAPAGTTRAYETHFQDANGGYGWNVNTTGDPGRSSTGAVYVGNEFMKYIEGQETARLLPGGGSHRFIDRPQGTVLDGQVLVAKDHGPKVETNPNDTGGIWKVKVDGKAPQSALLQIPETGLPTIWYGAGDAAAVGADPARTVRLVRSKTQVSIELPATGGKVDAALANSAEHLIRRVGSTSPVTFTGMKA